jgi:RNA exonuclease NGL2
MKPDFNFNPSDPAYSLIFGDSLLPAQEDLILSSRVVHVTIDPSILSTNPPSAASKTGEDGDDDDESDPDRVITQARPATPADGLLTIPEIVAWFQKLPRLRSAYSEGLRHAKEVGIDIETYGKRELLPDGRHGFDEPEYTSYTFYWKSVLGMCSA